MNLLQTKYQHRIIPRNSGVNWFPRSCGLTLGYFLWGYVKDKVYMAPIESIAALKFKIRSVINEINPPFCQKVIENFYEEIDMRGGRHPV